MVAVLGYEKHAMQHLFLTISTASRSRSLDSGPNEILPLLTFRAARLAGPRLVHCNQLGVPTLQCPQGVLAHQHITYGSYDIVMYADT